MTDEWTDREMGRKTNRHRQSQTDREMSRNVDRHAIGQETDRKMNGHIRTDCIHIRQTQTDGRTDEQI